MRQVKLPPLKELLSQLARFETEGEIHSALNLSKQITEIYPFEAESWLGASRTLDIAKNFKMSLFCLEKAKKISPDFLYVDAMIAMNQAKIGNVSEAIKLVNEINISDIKEGGILGIIGNVLSLCDEQEMAFRAFKKAYTLEPQNMEHKYNLANSYRYLGFIEKAEILFDQIVKSNPQDADAILTRSRLRKQTIESNHISWLVEQLESTVRVTGKLKVSILYSLVKEYEDLNQPKKSIECLLIASASHRKLMNYDVRQDIASVTTAKTVFTGHKNVLSKSNCKNNEPIFIVGLPRSGTTLTDRILDSHSQVKSVGELRNFSDQLLRLIRENSNLKFSSFMEAALSVDSTRLGNNYIESTRPRTGSASFFIDKMPQNYINIGLIRRSIPNAKIVILERNPMDTCFALYKAHFETGVRYSYSLEELGHYFLAYRELMNFWKQLFGAKLHTVQYELMVKDTESEARKMIDYCGLEWERQCLDFHKNSSPSSTGSSAQVRQPIYASSINRWKDYRLELEPLAKILIEGGIDIECQF